MKPVVLRPPVSKSDAHRALVLAEVCDGRHEQLLPKVADRPRDLEVLSKGLITLRDGEGTIDCLDAGAPFRFLLTQAALSPRTTVRFTGTVRLGERPHGPLIESLQHALGGSIVEGGAFWPLVVKGKATKATKAVTEFRVSGIESSQFASSLLLGAARLVQRGGAPVTVRVLGSPTSVGYFALTASWLRRFGFEVMVHPEAVVVESWKRVRAVPPIPGDWSSLTYLLPLAWKHGVSVAGVDPESDHPDRAFAGHLAEAGLSLTQRRGMTTVSGTLKRGLKVDASVCPDAVPALVALALVTKGPSVFERCGVLRLKESDRLEGLATLVTTLGGRATIAATQLTVTPPKRPRGGTFDGLDDHRLVMAAAVAAHLLGVDLKVKGTDAVNKSFPGFWREAAKVGLTPQEPR